MNCLFFVKKWKELLFPANIIPLLVSIATAASCDSDPGTDEVFESLFNNTIDPTNHSELFSTNFSSQSASSRAGMLLEYFRNTLPIKISDEVLQKGWYTFSLFYK